MFQVDETDMLNIPGLPGILWLQLDFLLLATPHRPRSGQESCLKDWWAPKSKTVPGGAHFDRKWRCERTAIRCD